MSKKLCLMLVLLLIVVVPSSVAYKKPAPRMVWPDRGEQIVPMVFNLRTSQAPEDGANGWIFRISPTVTMIRQEAPDIIALQEADRWQLDGLLTALPGFRCVTGGQGDQNKGYPVILVRADRFEVRYSERRWLSAVPQIIDSVGWGNPSPRCYTLAELVDRVTGRAFVIVSTHLDYQSTEARVESAKLLARVVESHGNLPVILAGDFNEAHDSEVLNPLRPTLLADSYRLAGRAEEGTLHGFSGYAGKARIDLVLVSRQWQVLDSHVVKYHKDRVYPSDHFPVVATLVLTGLQEQTVAAKP